MVKVDTPRQYSPEQTAALYGEVYEILDTRREELDIADIAYSYDRDTGRSRGFAFVEMTNATDAEAAISSLDGKDLHGRALRVNEAHDKPKGNRSGGGGTSL